MDSVNKTNVLVKTYFDPLLKEGILQYFEKELNNIEYDNTLLVFKSCPLEDLDVQNNEEYINEKYNKFIKICNIDENYSHVLFVIVFCSIEKFDSIGKMLPLKNIFFKGDVFAWSSSNLNKEFIESLKEFLFPISIKPAKKN
jgi:hypothetical protein